MRADADPEFHAERYGHWPTVRNEAGETADYQPPFDYTAPEIDPADEIDYDREPEDALEIVYVIDGRRYSETRGTAEAAAWVEGVVHGNGGHVLFVRPAGL